ncbi:cell death abnormality protein 1-like [Pomacea canaliculata]|uniref:cell death abnormality protein 1-like n=1 Tax=Pomacea canaliculata TaxID=400727 RepID=UPI000D738FE3|nr:cell death abnormality protein 1-like [Pomacea canaliculata]
MQAILLVTVFSCLLGAANGAAAALNAACTTTDGCTDTNAECSDAKCVCKTGFTEDSGSCAAIPQGKVNAACDTTTKKCTGTNVDCTGGFCTCKAGSSGSKGADDCTITPGTAGGACLASSPACTGDTLVCETDVCKKKGGQTCSATTECVSSSTCSTTCTCNDGYNTGSTGECTIIAEGKVNAACDATRNCTGVNDACTNGFCKCKTGFSGNKGDNDCSGVAPQYVSSWLLTISIILCLVTLSLP